MRRAIFVLSFLLAFAAPASANCTGVYFHDAAPRFAQPDFEPRELCFEAFAVEHSGATRTPLWSAEHLTAAGVEDAHALPRRDRFHAEPDLPRDERPELADYVGSGYDRGHMTPSGDMPTMEAQRQSFTLANVVPQARALNRGAWEDLEEKTRNLALRDNELFVVTGPVFARGAIPLIHDRVSVPDQIFKAVYDARRGAAGVYIAANSDGAQVRLISVAALQRLIGADVFPALAPTVKARASDILAGEPQTWASAAEAIRQALQR
jgi:endonuclease G